ncbi:tRNA (guanosine(37)-N1)-methyltransferase TrmD [Clostridia bacterium]|nr:tRNA (guanosine(37)-N1)-methyltransferase TrmD [Clostridia bacterium]
MIFDVLTLFPSLFDNFRNESLIQKAIENGILEIRTTNFRDYTYDRHNTVDDYPFGGGSGMLLKPEPIFMAHADLMQKTEASKTRTIYMSPSGTTLNHQKVIELTNYDHLVILCGRYEGVDQRVIDKLVDEEISIGDYVLFGGELPAMVLIEAISRQLEGVLGNNESLLSESFSNGLLEYPQYTKPREYCGLKVPEVLLSGNHKAIAQWKKEKSLEKTKERRPDLLLKIKKQ